MSKLLRTFSVYDALASFAIGYKLPFCSGQNTEFPTYFAAADQKYLSRNFTRCYGAGTDETLKDLAADKFYSILGGQGIVPGEKFIRRARPPRGSAEPDTPGVRSIDMDSNLYREYLLVKSGKVRGAQLDESVHRGYKTRSGQ